MRIDNLLYIKYNNLPNYSKISKIYIEGKNHKRYLLGLHTNIYATLRVYYFNSNVLEIFCFGM